MSETEKRKLLSDKCIPKHNVFCIKSKFLSFLSEFIQKQLRESFSHRNDSVNFQFSEYDPVGILVEAAQHAGIVLWSYQVPTKYWISTKLDIDQTQKSRLVFAITEISDGVEFAKEALLVIKRGNPKIMIR